MRISSFSLTPGLTARWLLGWSTSKRPHELTFHTDKLGAVLPVRRGPDPPGKDFPAQRGGRGVAGPFVAHAIAGHRSQFNLHQWHDFLRRVLVPKLQLG
jgi:hypothetical protein